MKPPAQNSQTRSPIDWLPDGVQALLPDSVEAKEGWLGVGGRRLDELSNQFGTPLYVYDELTLRNAARRTMTAFRRLGARVSFAAKACSTLGVLRVFAEEQLGLDVVSAGEIEAALRAGFTPQSIHLHGNAKTREELKRAVSLGLHAIVVDNFDELETLVAVCHELGASATIMLRVNLNMEADTHPHLQTGGHDSKFGFDQNGPSFEQAVAAVRESQCLHFLGLHTHLGSQIADPGLYQRSGGALASVLRTIRATGLACRELSLGGGWYVPYRPDHAALEPEVVSEALQPVAHSLKSEGIRLAVEPGRALCARAGMALYRVRSVKRRKKRFMVAVDGGMGDNPRPALYGARYTALPIREQCYGQSVSSSLVGRFCESGDVLVYDVSMPLVQTGDVVCVPVSGAYQLSMASSYNLVPPPAAVMVNDGLSRILRRRATVDDLLRQDAL